MKIKSIAKVIIYLVLLGSAAIKPSFAVNHQEILQAYADIAHASYSDSLKRARDMQAAIKNLAENPNANNLMIAKQSWLAAREPYGFTEIFRLSNGPIDSEEGWVAKAYGALEGQINAWPLDENMIDYTIDAKGKKTSGNIIDTGGDFKPQGKDGRVINIKNISPEVIAALNENGGEANVASGFHAIEFLLWGQDQDYGNFTKDRITNGALTAGMRPLSDFTTDRHAGRRLAYLKAAAVKLVNDLETVANAWSYNISSNCEQDATGCYRAALLGKLSGVDRNKNLKPETALKQIIGGMGMFIKSELANERIAVAVLTPSEEDEHSCFSDNTHRDIAQNFQGFVGVLRATYKNKDYGNSMYNALSRKEKSEINRLIADISSMVENINYLAATKWHFDYQILAGNNAKEIRKAKNLMRKLGDKMVDVAKALKIKLNVEDVTDPEETRI